MTSFGDENTIISSEPREVRFEKYEVVGPIPGPGHEDLGNSHGFDAAGRRFYPQQTALPGTPLSRAAKAN
ncbi:MAG: hypothetical protein JW801_05150 [Bacteroidales bacterium]|nr:hypothetical protein [Bacteroidales bacterium]